MKLVVGLGNPGRKYAGTRHNIGFDVLTELAQREHAPPPRKSFDCALTEIHLAGERTLLAWPQTFMNLSGRAVRQAADFYKIAPESVLVLCDDLNLPCGKLRLRSGGSAGGQKGLQNIIQQLGTEAFPRLRVGIGRPPPPIDPVDYVLSRFRREEQAAMAEAVGLAADAVGVWASDGIAVAMNRFNAGDKGPSPPPASEAGPEHR